MISSAMTNTCVSNGFNEVAATSLAERLLSQMLLIRKFEERVLELFDEGVLVGTTHCYIGQEADAVGVLTHLSPRDVVWSNHRCHGHYLTFTDDVDGLMAELMGKATGVVGGRGGSQHLCLINFASQNLSNTVPAEENGRLKDDSRGLDGGFFSNGVQGGIVPAAVGMAFAERYRRSGALVTVFLGDGTLGEGVVYESFNLAALWNLPVLFVIENNRYAQSTPVEKQLAGSIAERPRAFGIPTTELASFDVMEIHQATGPIVQRIRDTGGPAALVLHTYRFCHHSKSDDHRDSAEVAQWRAFDPIALSAGRLPNERVAALEQQAVARIQAAEALARQAPFPSLQVRSLDEAMDLR